MSTLADMNGVRLGRLLVIDRAANDSDNRAVWWCRCDCGRRVKVRGKDLRTGHTSSCGCSHVKHGESGSKLHAIWIAMRQRCANSRLRVYQYYGGRGIRVCDHWQQFDNFAKWAAGAGYKDGLSIDRINNDGNYEPANCQWLTLSANISKRMLNTRGGRGRYPKVFSRDAEGATTRDPGDTGT